MTHQRARIVSEAITAHMAAPYRLGRSDCFLAGCAVIDALRGTDHEAAFRGRYTTYRGAARVLRKEGHTSLADLLTGWLGDPVLAARAGLGDVAVCDIDGAEHLAIHTGRAFIGKTPNGTTHFGLSDVNAAFKV